VRSGKETTELVVPGVVRGETRVVTCLQNEGPIGYRSAGYTIEINDLEDVENRDIGSLATLHGAPPGVFTIKSASEVGDSDSSDSSDPVRGKRRKRPRVVTSDDSEDSDGSSCSSCDPSPVHSLTRRTRDQVYTTVRTVINHPPLAAAVLEGKTYVMSELHNAQRGVCAVCNRTRVLTFGCEGPALQNDSNMIGSDCYEKMEMVQRAVACLNEAEDAQAHMWSNLTEAEDTVKELMGQAKEMRRRYSSAGGGYS
jgi:hypothetical protein